MAEGGRQSADGQLLQKRQRKEKRKSSWLPFLFHSCAIEVNTRSSR